MLSERVLLRLSRLSRRGTDGDANDRGSWHFPRLFYLPRSFERKKQISVPWCNSAQFRVQIHSNRRGDTSRGIKMSRQTGKHWTLRANGRPARVGTGRPCIVNTWPLPAESVDGKSSWEIKLTSSELMGAAG